MKHRALRTATLAMAHLVVIGCTPEVAPRHGESGAGEEGGGGALGSGGAGGSGSGGKGAGGGGSGGAGASGVGGGGVGGSGVGGSGVGGSGVGGSGVGGSSSGGNSVGGGGEGGSGEGGSGEGGQGVGGDGSGGASSSCNDDLDCDDGNACTYDYCVSQQCKFFELADQTPLLDPVGDCLAVYCFGLQATVVIDDTDVPSQDASDCVSSICVAGQVVVTPNDGEIPGNTPNDCMLVSCVAGQPVAAIDDTDLPDDGDPCTVEGCSQGFPTLAPAPAGTSCPAGVCNGDASTPKCVGCLGDADCPPAHLCDLATQSCICVPATCGGLGMTCGVVSDGCGGIAMCDDQAQGGGETDIDCGGDPSLCVTRCGVGQACLQGSDCAGGKCADGVCCNVTCAGGCEQCDAPQSLGTCAPHPAGTDPEQACSLGACDGAGQCAAGTDVFGRGLPGNGTGASRAPGVVSDALGNTILAGQVGGAIDYGAGWVTVAGFSGEDILLVKYDPQGNLLWGKTFGDGANQHAVAVAVDSQDNIVIVGDFKGSLSFAPGSSFTAGNGYAQTFIAKFSPAGDHLWSKMLTTSWEGAMGVAIGPLDEVIVAGSFMFTTDFGAGPVTASGFADAFLLKLDASGNYLWNKPFGDAANQYAVAVATDPTGNITMAGNFLGSINFGGGQLVSTGLRDIFIARFDTFGAHIFSHRYGTASQDDFRGLTVDAAGNVVFSASATIDFGNGITCGPYCLAKLDASGAHVWSRKCVSGSSIVAGMRSVPAVDAAGSVFYASTYSGTSVDLGGGPVPGPGSGTYVLKVDSAGVYGWVRTFDPHYPTGAAIDPAGNFVWTGIYTGPFSFGGAMFPPTQFGVTLLKIGP